MTVSGSNTYNTYTGDGLTTAFAYTFKAFDSSSVKVYLNGVLQAAGYTLVPPPPNSGGNVVFAIAPTAAMAVRIERTSNILQLIDLQDNVGLPAESIEEMSDRLCLIAQELYRCAERAILVDSDTLVNVRVIPVANGLLQFNATADGITAVLPSILVPGTVLLSPFGQAWVQLLTAAAARGYLGMTAFGDLWVQLADAAAGRTALGMTALGSSLVQAASEASARSILLIPGRNKIMNSQFRVYQRGNPITSTSYYPNNDAAYTLDRWLLLSDGNNVADITVGASGGTVPTTNGAGITVVTPNKKFGFLQIVDFFDWQTIANNGRASLSFYAASNVGISNIRAAILSWNGGVSVDPVASWNGAGVNPTLIAQWAYLGATANIPLTAAYQRFKLENIDVSGLPFGTYLGVMVWCDDTNAIAGDNIALTGVQLEAGAVATEYEDKNWSQEILECSKYFRTSFAWSLGVNPRLGPSDSTGCPIMTASAAGIPAWHQLLVPPMWRNPTVTIFNPVTATNTLRNLTDGTDAAVGASSSYGANGLKIFPSLAAAHNNDLFSFHYAANAEI